MTVCRQLGAASRIRPMRDIGGVILTIHEGKKLP